MEPITDNNCDVFPGIILNIYEAGYETRDPNLCEETWVHECSTNHWYLDQHYRNQQ